MALNVRAEWPAGGADEFWYRDTLSTPPLKVTTQRLTRYRIMDYGDWIFTDEISGLTGRPLSGFLALIFKVLGEGSIVQSRMAVADDGMQVIVATAKKWFVTKTPTLTVPPNGKAIENIPPDRPDLLKIEEMLRQDVEIEYEEW